MSSQVLIKKSIRQLQLVQNAAARVLANTKIVKLITPALEKLHWLLVWQRIDYKVLLFVYKASNGPGLKYTCDLIVCYEAFRPLRLTKTGLLSVPRIKTKQSEAAFSFCAHI